MKVSLWWIPPCSEFLILSYSRATALIHSLTSNSVIITPEIAKKYFGNADPMGKSFEMQLGDTKQLFTIAGIAEQAPEESSIKYDILIPYANDKLDFSAKNVA